MSTVENVDYEAADDPAPRTKASPITMHSPDEKNSEVPPLPKVKKWARIMRVEKKHAPRKLSPQDISVAKKSAEIILKYAIEIQEALPIGKDRDVEKALKILESWENEANHLRLVPALLAFPAVDTLKQCSEYKHSEEIRNAAGRLYGKYRTIFRVQTGLDFEKEFQNRIEKFLIGAKNLVVYEDDFSDGDKEDYASEDHDDSDSDDN